MPDIRFDQGDTGTVNRSRSDITKDVVVTVNALNLVGSAVFALLAKPQGAAAVLAGAGSTRTITPDVAGTYRVRIFDDGDSSQVIHTFTVRTAKRAIAIPAHNERASAQANLADTDPGTWVNESETNEGGHFEGWHRHMVELAQKVENDGPLTSAAPAAVDRNAASAGASLEAARADHKHDVATAVPVEITDATVAIGSSLSLSRADHQHAHGNRGGGALHALAIAAGAAGFMSGTDKQKLDRLGAIALARRTTAFTLGATYDDVDFDVTDVETQTSVLDHQVGTFPDRILVGASGSYLVGYFVQGVYINADGVLSRVRINDTGGGILASQSGSGVGAHNNNHDYRAVRVFVASLTAGDYLTLQLSRAAGVGPTALAGMIFWAARL